MNINLVKGAKALSTPTQPTWDESFSAGLEQGNKVFQEAQQYAKSERNAINQKVAGYIDALDTNVDITELTGTQQKAITNYLVKQRNEYADAASRIAKIDDPSSPMYSELRDKINGIQMSFKSLAGQVNSYKKDKASYLKDFDNNLISDGNDLSTLSESANLYTDGASLGVSEGGGLVFYNEGKETFDSYNQMPKPFLKDFGAADQLLQMNSSVYSSGRALTGARKNMMRQKLNNIISKGGRSSLLSMASDDFIMEGGLGIQDPELFKPGNDDALKQAVMDSYMEVLSNSATQGANDKRPASGSKTAGIGGALRDEINTGGPAVNKAMDFAQAFAVDVPSNQRETKTREMVAIINSIDPSSKQVYNSRSQFFNALLNAEGSDWTDDKEGRARFNQKYGSAQIFAINPNDGQESRGVAINTDNPQDVYEFYLKNTDLSSKAQGYFIDQFRNQGTKNNQQASSDGSMSKYN
tara:strand:+ start:3781 stop:5187 length:1407 start_codon:yes stop_codon:yes gene_type:complete